MDFDVVLEKLKNTNLAEVTRETKVSRQTLYNVLNNKNSTKETFEKLLNYFRDKESAELYQNLKFYGAPLFESAKKTDSLENTLLKALSVSRDDGLVESVLPYMFFKNRAVVDLKQLYRESVKLDLDRLLGYYLDVSTHFRPNKEFEGFLKLMKSLGNYGFKMEKDLSKAVPLNNRKVPTYALSAYMQNPVALDWGLLVRGDLKHHLERYEKWAKLES